MGTPYKVVYDAFLSKVNDPFFLQLDREEADMEFLAYLDQAIPLFLYPKVDLDDRDNDLQEFSAILTVAEIQIISEIMKLKWVEQQIADEELIKMQYSDHDYSLMSQAAHLFRLITLKQEIEGNVKRMQHVYTKVKDRKPDFSGLAGR